MSLYAHMCVQEPLEARRGHQISWSWSHRCLGATMWALGTKPRSPAEQLLLNHWAVSQPWPGLSITSASHSVCWCPYRSSKRTTFSNKQLLSTSVNSGKSHNIKSQTCVIQARWYTSVIPAERRLRQKDELEAHVVRVYLPNLNKLDRQINRVTCIEMKFCGDFCLFGFALGIDSHYLTLAILALALRTSASKNLDSRPLPSHLTNSAI